VSPLSGVSWWLARWPHTHRGSVIAITRPRQRVGAEEADEEPLAVVTERDLARPAARPAEHLAERELPLLCGLDALLRGHLPHPLDPFGVDPQAGDAWDRLTGAERRWLLCCFPH